MAKWYEWSNVKWFRLRAEERLKDLPPAKDKNETAEAFWARVEKAGRLIEALELYDQIAEGNAKWVHLPRETKKMFVTIEKVVKFQVEPCIETSAPGFVSG